jgi:hypothetical protein
MLVIFLLNTMSRHLRGKKELNRAGGWPSLRKNQINLDLVDLHLIYGLVSVRLYVNDPEDWAIMIPSNDH